ncbi:MAG: type III pantothenate kinase [Rhodospirillales bacterium]|jgi:type III pantothenate kinase|nr:type III pantothenate kinase [Rhodospirillales bacterium]
MLLAIDSGNTNAVFAVFAEDGTIVGEWRSATEGTRTADEYGIWLMGLMTLVGIDPKRVGAAVIASVVPATLFNLKTLCRKYFETEPLIIGDEGVDLGVGVRVARPEEVGADRLVNTVAAHHVYGGPVIVVDFGTATTFDVIDAEGDYIGGVIAPGVNLSLEALHAEAAQLPRVAVERPPRVIGTATVPAMQSGIFWGYVSMIEGLVARIAREFGSPMDVIATGGLAPLFAESIDVIKACDPDLTLKGLHLIYERNRRS